ncbi:MAG: hypothetical protein J5886_02135, partial [Bacteroidales bacterium]|nr:hypothetical protein [Bacteroidales bacterium]
VYKYSKDQETRRESDLKVDVIYDKEYVAEQVFIPKTGSEAFPAIDYLEIRKNDKDFQFVSGIKEDSDKYVHLIVGGTTDMAVAMAQTAAHICHFPNFKDGRYRTIITFVDKSMSSWMSHFVCAYDNLFRLSHFKYISFSEGGKPLITYHTPDLDYGDFLDIEWEFVDADLCSTEFSPLLRDAIADDRQALSVVICLPTQQDCTFAATHLPADIYWKGCPIFVHQQDHGDILRQAARTHQFGNLHIFGMASGLIGDALFVNRSTLGRRINFIYDQAQQKVENRHKNEAEAWFDLREAHKFSSIYCANALPMRARSFGLDNFDLSHLQVSQRTSMYETEHRRWMMSSLLLGYRAMNTKYRNELKSKRLDPSTAKEADDVFRTLKTSFFLHMDITPYEDLLPEEKDKDRIILDEISFILNRNE